MYIGYIVVNWIHCCVVLGVPGGSVYASCSDVATSRVRVYLCPDSVSHVFPFLHRLFRHACLV